MNSRSHVDQAVNQTQEGTELCLRFEPPAELGNSLLDEVEALIMQGGAVSPRWVRHNLEQAALVALALAGPRLVGSVTLKHPRPEYVQRLMRQTGLDLADYLERGYTAIHRDYRGMGLGTRLVAGLTRQALGRAIYVVIATDNLAAEAITRRCGTRLATRFISPVTGREYGIWLQGKLPEDV